MKNKKKQKAKKRTTQKKMTKEIQRPRRNINIPLRFQDNGENDLRENVLISKTKNRYNGKNIKLVYEECKIKEEKKAKEARARQSLAIESAFHFTEYISGKTPESKSRSFLDHKRKVRELKRAGGQIEELELDDISEEEEEEQKQEIKKQENLLLELPEEQYEFLFTEEEENRFQNEFRVVDNEQGNTSFLLAGPIPENEVLNETTEEISPPTSPIAEISEDDDQEDEKQKQKQIIDDRRFLFAVIDYETFADYYNYIKGIDQ